MSTALRRSIRSRKACRNAGRDVRVSADAGRLLQAILRGDMIGNGFRVEIARRPGGRHGIRRRSFSFRSRFFHKRLWMQLVSKVFDHRNNAGRRTNDGLVNKRKTTIAYGIQDLPARDDLRAIRNRFRRASMSSGEDEIVGLKTGNFFKIDLGPILVRIDNGGRSGPMNRVGDKGTFPTDMRGSGQTIKSTRVGGTRVGFASVADAAKIVGEGFPGGSDVQDFGELLYGGNNLVDV